MEPTSVWVIALVLLAHTGDGATHRIEPPRQGYFTSALDCRTARPQREAAYMRTDGLRAIHRLGKELGLQGEINVTVHTVCMRQPFAVI